MPRVVEKGGDRRPARDCPFRTTRRWVAVLADEAAVAWPLVLRGQAGRSGRE